MKRKVFFTKGIKVVLKFIFAGLIAMAVIVLFKNRNDILSIGVSTIIAFILGGIAMALSLSRELKSLIRENNSLKRKIKRAENEIENFNKTLDEIPVNSFINFEETKTQFY